MAKALGAEKLVFLSDVNGVRRDKDDPQSLIHSLSADEAQGLIASGVIDAGMIPKVEACLETVRRNDLDACYIRPMILRGYGAASLYAEGCETQGQEHGEFDVGMFDHLRFSGQGVALARMRVLNSSRGMAPPRSATDTMPLTTAKRPWE